MKNYKQIFDTYINDISNGKILAGEYCKKSIKRFKDDLKHQKEESFNYEFKFELAEEILEFAETLFIPDINKTLELLPWHIFIYGNLYGWVYKDNNNRRRFRSGYAEVSRKNSKTTSILFPIILYDFLTTPSAEAYMVSQDGYQSEKSFKELKQIIKHDNKLKQVINETISAVTFNGSRIAFFSSESGGIDSYKNSCSVIDEFHGYDSDKIITAFKYGGRARLNNLVLIITSAGTNIAGPCYAENEKARKILNGVMNDDTYFSIIYAYDDKDDWKDSTKFIKANPSLGPILKQDILEQDLNDAIITPSHQSDFKAKTCGIWTNDTTNWIPLQKWDTEIRNSELVKPEIVYAAIDLSSIKDFTAYTKCWQYEGNYYLHHRFYIPSATVQEKYLKENIGIIDWINKGLVIATPGPTVDYDYLIKDIEDDINNGIKIEEIAYDRWQAINIMNKIEEKFPHIILIDYPQNLKNMAGPSNEYERLIMEDKIVDPSPVMKWMVSNAEIKPDVNGNFKPLKDFKTSTKKIDGVITSIMAIDRCKANINNVSSAKSINDILKLF
jgi:phage terminase large subunit-like protein